MASTSKPQTIIYKTIGSLEIPLDIYLPSDAKSVPVLVWFHGGGLLQGRRDQPAQHLVRSVEKYRHAVISADYRLAPQASVSDICEDVLDCVRFVRDPQGLSKHIGSGIVDSNKLAVSGSSAGGFLAFLAGLYCEPKPNVILPIYPITDALGYFFTNTQPLPLFKPPGAVDKSKKITQQQVASFADPKAKQVANNAPDSERAKMYFYMLAEANLAELWGMKTGQGAYDEKENDRWRIAKAIPERRLPPTYIVHGDLDRAVGVEQSDEVVGVMVGEGLEVKYERVKGLDHIFDVFDPSVELDGMYKFMHAHLRGQKL